MDWQPIETVPRDGLPVWLKHEAHPEYGQQLLWWERGQWVGMQFGPMGKIRVGWDPDLPQPTHWRSMNPFQAHLL